MHKDSQFNLYFREQISQKETIITDQLCRSLTELNLKRIELSEKGGMGPKKGRNSDKRNYLYVCVTGLPAFKQEFEGIRIPGEKIVVYPSCCNPYYTPEQSKAELQSAQLEAQAALLHQRLANRTDKPIVLVFHSFGTAIVSTFCRIYYSDYVHRVVGMVPIGAYPIRADLHFSNYVLWTQSLSKAQIWERGEEYYLKEKERMLAVDIVPAPNKYAYMSVLLAFGHGLGFDEMFSYIRRWFPVLKCFIYGRQDNRLSEEGLNQSAVYYCHKQKITPENEVKVQQFLKETYNLTVDNAQERFIYNLEGGKHSIHMQRRFKSLISQILNEYLTVLEEIVPEQG